MKQSTLESLSYIYTEGGEVPVEDLKKLPNYTKEVIGALVGGNTPNCELDPNGNIKITQRGVTNVEEAIRKSGGTTQPTQPTPPAQNTVTPTPKPTKAKGLASLFEDDDWDSENDVPEPVPSPKPEKKPKPVLTSKPEFQPVKIGKELIPEKFTYYPRKIKNFTDVEIFVDSMNQGKVTLLIGPTGSGKTALARWWASDAERPYRRVSLNGGATAEDLIGHYILKNDGKGNSETVWVDGVLTQCYKNGWTFVADEINGAPADVLFVLNPVLDDEKILVLTQKDGEIIEAHPDFRFVATCNPSEKGYAGTKEMNEALLDRFQRIIYIDYNMTVERKILQERNIKKELQDEILMFTERLRTSYNNNELITPFSTRTLINFVELIEMGEPKLILNRFKESERAIVSDILDVIIQQVSW